MGNTNPLGFGEKLSVRSNDVATSLVRYQRWPWKRLRGYATFGARQTCGAPKNAASALWLFTKSAHIFTTLMPRGIPLRSCSFATCQVAPAPLPFWIFFLGNHHFVGQIMVEWQDSTMKIISHIDLQNLWISHDFSWWNGKAEGHLLPSFGWLSGKGICTASGARVTIAGSDDVLTETVRCVMKDRNCWSMLIWTPIFVQKFGSIDWFLPIQKAQSFQVSILDRVNPRWSPGLWSIFVLGGVPFYS
jgi:hypothetical protein